MKNLIILIAGLGLWAGVHAQGIYVTGNGVGVGTANPQGGFSVSFNDGDLLSLYSPGGNTLALQTLLDGRSLATYGTYGGAFENRLLLQPLIGNVGIGERWPLSKLHIQANTSSDGQESVMHGLAISTGTAGQTLWMGYDGTQDIAYINAAKSGAIRPLVLQSRGGEVRLQGAPNPNGWSTHFNYSFPGGGANYIRGDTIIADGGNKVGINTTTLDETLNVNGRIKHKGLVTAPTTWADYVFEDGYRLAPLSEVEEHIKTAGHLPGIPSAEEATTKGIEMVDMQIRLLAKVEELTLHLIAMEKRMAAQQARIAELEGGR